MDQAATHRVRDRGDPIARPHRICEDRPAVTQRRSEVERDAGPGYNTNICWRRYAHLDSLIYMTLIVPLDITGFLEDLNPQLLSTINSEFEKVAGQTPPEPTRTSADLQDVTAASGKAGGKSGGGDPLDDLIPRVDLDKLVAQTSVVADSKSDAWKVRKEAFESLAALLEVKSNSRLKPSMGEYKRPRREDRLFLS